MNKELSDANYCQYLNDVVKSHKNFHSPKMNCLTYGIHSWHPRFWLRNIVQFFRNLELAKQRIVYGFCDWDWWEMNDHLMVLTADMLDHLATHSCGYPGVKPYGTYEKWQSALYINAYKLRAALDVDNECYEANEALREQYKDEAFNWIKDNFRFLWD